MFLIIMGNVGFISPAVRLLKACVASRSQGEGWDFGIWSLGFKA